MKIAGDQKEKLLDKQDTVEGNEKRPGKYLYSQPLFPVLMGELRLKCLKQKQNFQFMI